MSTESSVAARIARRAGILESTGTSCASRSGSRRDGARPSASGSAGLDDRLVFVVGSPRSGTTFLAGAIGSLPGFVDLGEVAPLKAAVPELAALEPDEAARRLRRILAIARRVGLVGAVRPVEQTPELAYRRARSRSRIRRRASSTSSATAATSSARSSRRPGFDASRRRPTTPVWRTARTRASGSEPERRDEFEAASDARRAAWVWRTLRDRRAIRRAPPRDPVRGAGHRPGRGRRRARRLPRRSVEPLAEALARAHAASVGRYRADLTDEQLADVEDEAGDLLRELGYVSSASA